MCNILNFINYFHIVLSFRSFIGGSVVKNLHATKETQVQSLDQEYPLEKEMATHSSILAGKLHGQRSLEGYSPWESEESNI